MGGRGESARRSPGAAEPLALAAQLPGGAPRVGSAGRARAARPRRHRIARRLLPSGGYAIADAASGLAGLAGPAHSYTQSLSNHTT